MKYKVYSLEDFVAPIVDSIEGITHSFRDNVDTQRNAQYEIIWNMTCKGQRDLLNTGLLQMSILKPFSRLNMENIELSNCKLSELINDGICDDWNDLRLPTLRGLFRRGLQLKALDTLIMTQPLHDTTLTNESWNKLWSLNIGIVHKIANRYFVVSTDSVVINIKNITSVSTISKIFGGKQKTITIAPKVLVERFSLKHALMANKQNGKDKMLLPGLGAIHIDIHKVDMDNLDDITCIDTIFDAKHRNFKDFNWKQKLNWIADTGQNEIISAKLIEVNDLDENESQRMIMMVLGWQ